MLHNFAKIECVSVGVMKMYSNRGVYLCNAILATEIFWHLSLIHI